MINDIDDDRHTEEDDPHANGGQQQTRNILFLQRTEPERLQNLMIFITENASVAEAEEDCAQAAKHQQSAGIAQCRRKFSFTEAQEESAECQHGSLPDVAEHVSEHDDEGDSDKNAGVEFE